MGRSRKELAWRVTLTLSMAWDPGSELESESRASYRSGKSLELLVTESHYGL